MIKGTLLVIFAGTGSALCWWPLIIEPNLDLPVWTPLALIALITVVSTVLSEQRWPRFVIASSVGAFTGICGGFAIWPPSDGIVASYVPIEVCLATLAAAVVSLVMGLGVRQLLKWNFISVSNENLRWALWLAVICPVALGPVAIAVTPSVVAFRVKRNDRLAAERFEALNTAVQQTMDEAGGPKHVCDGQALKRHYSGPPFSEQDWRRIVYTTGDRAEQNGYVFEIHCDEEGGYAIGAWPNRLEGDGTRRFCSDESGKITGCDMGRVPMYACIPCTK